MQGVQERLEEAGGRLRVDVVHGVPSLYIWSSGGRGSTVDLADLSQKRKLAITIGQGRGALGEMGCVGRIRGEHVQLCQCLMRVLRRWVHVGRLTLGLA